MRVCASFTAPFDQFVGALTQFSGLALSELAALVGSLGQVLTSFFPWFGRGKNDTCKRTKSQACQKIDYFRSAILCHSNLALILKVRNGFAVTGGALKW